MPIFRGPPGASLIMISPVQNNFNSKYTKTQIFEDIKTIARTNLPSSGRFSLPGTGLATELMRKNSSDGEF